MASSLEELDRRTRAIGELHEIVGAMQALAAVRLQKASTGLEATRAYADAVAGALGMVLPAEATAPVAPGSRAPRALLVFAPEHGFSGALARHLVESAAEARTPEVSLFMIGSRGLVFAEEAGLPLAWSMPLATEMDAAAATARRVSDEVHRRFAAGALSGVDVLFPVHERGGHTRMVSSRLLPFDPTRHGNGRPSQPPLTNLPVAELLPRLVEEYFFAELAHAVVETFAAENSARLAVMQSARRHVEETLEELHREERRTRQSAITTEIAEVAAGVLALDDR